MKGYETYKDEPRVVQLRKDVLNYNKQLFHLHIRDHQVGYSKHPWYWVVFLLIFRVFKLLCLSIAVLTGTIHFAPIFITGKLISIKKSSEALAASSVKIRARDVVATWKILVSLALTPILDITYTSILTWWVYYNRIGGRVPERVPLKLVAIGGLLIFPAFCFMALRFGEIGMDIFKSLRPLLLSISPGSSYMLVKLQDRREDLTTRINDLINELGPELYPDFNSQRIIDDPSHPLHSPDRSRPTTPTHKRDGSEIDAINFTPATPPTLQRGPMAPLVQIPRNESFKNIGSVGIFASRPGTPNRSRSRTNSGSDSSGFHGRGFSGLRGFTSLEPAPAPKAKADLDEVSRNLHAAMRERGQRRKSEPDEWEFQRSATPMSEVDGEDDEKKDV